MSAATRAETAADIALKATGIALDAGNEAERHAATLAQLVPTPAAIVAELASHEQSAWSRRWAARPHGYVGFESRMGLSGLLSHHNGNR